MKALFLLLLIASTAFGGTDQEKKLVDYLSTLVSMPTETADKEENAKALHWIEKELTPLGLHFEHRVFNGHPNLIVTTKKTMAPDIFLVAHMDVVPAPKSLFTPRIEGEKMYGRGAYDMKMAIACYLLLLHELKDQLPTLNIGLMLTSDEEIGGMNGVKRLLELGYTSKVAFLPDGGFNWHFEEEAKGVLQIKVSTCGKSSHSSRPDLGDNAIEILITALEKLPRYFAQQKNGSYYPTYNVGIIQGGKAVNQVPDSAEARIDIRYPPAIKRKDLYTDMAKLLQQDQRVTLEITAEGSPHKVDVRQAPFIRFQEIAKKLYGIDVGKTHSHGSSDARFFGERNIPVLMLAPKGGNIHGDGEWIDLKDLTRFYHVLKNWVLA